MIIPLDRIHAKTKRVTPFYTKHLYRPPKNKYAFLSLLSYFLLDVNVTSSLYQQEMDIKLTIGL